MRYRPGLVRDVIRALHSSVTDDLLKPKYRDSKIPLYGSCYIVSEAFYHLVGKPLGVVPFRARDRKGNMHYWLQSVRPKNAFPGIKLDLTAIQYTSRGIKFDYSKGKRCAFQFPSPCKRTQILIKRVKKILKEPSNVQA